MKYTKEQLNDIQAHMLNSLIACAGSVPHLARMLELPTPTVQGWKVRGRISKAGACLVEEHPMLGQVYTMSDLRPDQ